jgi:hypothetical protein
VKSLVSRGRSSGNPLAAVKIMKEQAHRRSTLTSGEAACLVIGLQRL